MRGDTKPCDSCGKEFIKKSIRHRFCSDGCSLGFVPGGKDTEYRLKIHERDGYRCAYCGLSSIEDGVKLCLDHIVPCCIGGSNYIGNLITSCMSCNFQKGKHQHDKEITDRLLAEVRRRGEKLKEQREKSNLNRSR